GFSGPRLGAGGRAQAPSVAASGPPERLRKIPTPFPLSGRRGWAVGHSRAPLVAAPPGCESGAVATSISRSRRVLSYLIWFGEKFDETAPAHRKREGQFARREWRFEIERIG